ncbi:MAG: methionyl-tRNA formyltransferase [Helicobacteraceae bacterium]|nr:methionyl-tRNA formyltransferase [Helicobacteraceae bacterium]
MPKIVFMGTPKYAAIILSDLLDFGANIVLALTQEDKPFGRKQILKSSEVKTEALKRNIPIAQPHKLDDIAVDLESLKPDLIIVAAYGQMISDRVLSIAPCWNLHASLLPKYRGASPIQAALLSADRFSGVTLMKVRKTLDSGETIAFSLIDTSQYDLQTLTIALAKTGAKLVLSALKTIDNVQPIAQNHCESSLVKKIKRQDALIDFNRSAKEIENAARAYRDRPNIYLQNDLQLIDVKALDLNGTIGEILAVDKSAKSVIIGCKVGAASIAKVCPSGKGVMSAMDYLNGKRLGVGDLLS